MTPNRWGVIWPDGSYTGAIGQLARDVAHYAKQHDGQVYEIGSAEDPERREAPPIPTAPQVQRNQEELFA